MKNAKIDKEGFHFHSLRHVHVAYLIGQGVDIYAISKRLGHANVNITLKVYAYLIDEYKAKNDNLIVEKLQKI
jgi:integrase